MLVVNLRNMSENKVNAGEFVAAFKIRSMGRGIYTKKNCKIV